VGQLAPCVAASSAGRKQGSLPEHISLGTVFVIVLPNPLTRDPAQASPKAITKRISRCSSMRGVFTIIYLFRTSMVPWCVPSLPVIPD
jgi:hypothetical protein